MVEIDVSRKLDRPAEDVFDFLADASNNPSWQGGMRSCEWTTDPPLGLSSTYEQIARFMGREVRTTFVVADFEPGRKIVIESVESTFPINVERRVDPAGPDSCRVTASIRGGPEGPFARLLSPVITWMARRSVNRDYDRLVELLEPS